MLCFKITKQSVWVFSVVELAKLFVFKKCFTEWFALIEFPLILLQNITLAKKSLLALIKIKLIKPCLLLACSYHISKEDLLQLEKWVFDMNSRFLLVL